jgi:hypothetical protein
MGAKLEQKLKTSLSNVLGTLSEGLFDVSAALGRKTRDPKTGFAEKQAAQIAIPFVDVISSIFSGIGGKFSPTFGGIENSKNAPIFEVQAINKILDNSKVLQRDDENNLNKRSGVLQFLDGIQGNYHPEGIKSQYVTPDVADAFVQSLREFPNDLNKARDSFSEGKNFFNKAEGIGFFDKIVDDIKSFAEVGADKTASGGKNGYSTQSADILQNILDAANIGVKEKDALENAAKSLSSFAGEASNAAKALTDSLRGNIQTGITSFDRTNGLGIRPPDYTGVITPFDNQTSTLPPKPPADEAIVKATERTAVAAEKSERHQSTISDLIRKISNLPGGGVHQWVNGPNGKLIDGAELE